MKENAEKRNQEITYDKLTEEQKAASIPYFVHEMEMTRLKRINFLSWILTIFIFVAFVVTNAGWIVYENQFEDISIEQDGETDGGGNNYFNGTGEFNLYGEGEASNQNPQEESGR